MPGARARRVLIVNRKVSFIDDCFNARATMKRNPSTKEERLMPNCFEDVDRERSKIFILNLSIGS